MPNGIDFVEDTAPATNEIDFQAAEAVTPSAVPTQRILPPNAQFKLTPYQQAAMEGRDTGMFGEGPMAIARGQPGAGGEAIAAAPQSFAEAGRAIGRKWEATGIPQVGRDLLSDFLVRTGIDPSSTPTPELGKVINLPRLTPDMVTGLPQPLQIGAGVANVVPTFIEGIAQDPALLVATAGAGTVARFARTILGTEQLLSLPQEVRDAVKVWSDPKSSTAEKTESLLQPGVSAIFAREMIRHGWRPKGPEQITGEDLQGRPQGAPLPPQPPPVPTEPVPPRTAFPPGPAPSTPVPPREAYPPGPAPTTPVPPREAFPPGPAPNYPPAQQWAFRPDLPPGPAPRAPVPPRPPETAPAKPAVAQLEPDAPGKARNPHGDPVGTTYYATPEDWAAWQKLKKLPAKERVLTRSAEYEALRNKYGGADPLPPRRPDPPVPPEQFPPLTPDSRRITIKRADGTTYEAAAGSKDWPKEFTPPGVPSSATIHRLSADGKWSTGFLDQGESIVEHAAEPAPTPAAEPTPAEAPAAEPITSPVADPIGETVIEGKPLREWEKVTKAEDLPKGEARARLARRIGVNNQPQKILDRLKQPKKLREILAPPPTPETLQPVAPPAPIEEAAPPTETKPAAPETKPPISETKPPVSETPPAPAATPTPAAKAQAEVSKVAATEGQRSAKEIKSQLVSELEAAHEAAPLAGQGEPKQVVIDIPGDGVFTINNTKEALAQVLARAKRIKTEPPKTFTESKPSPETRKQYIKEAEELARAVKYGGSLYLKRGNDWWEINRERGGEPIADEKVESKSLITGLEDKAKSQLGPTGGVGPGAAASAEFTARENRRRLLADFTERLFGSRAGEAVDAFLRKMAGEAVPKTMALSGEAGNKMVRFAAANNAAPHIAKSLTLEVLGDNFKNPEFRERLGAVLVEDRLRAIRKGLEDAAGREADPTKKEDLLSQAHDVNSLVGEGKPFSSEADFLNAIDDPEIAKAIEAHKTTIQPEAERFHTEAQGQLAGPGVHTGAFVNLLPIFEDRPEMIFRGAKQGDYTRPFKRKSVFSRTAKGTAAKYELDYGTLAERMIRGNYEEYTKRQLYNQLVADKLAVIQPPGQPPPKFDGRPAEKFQIRRQTLVTPTGAVSQYENLWVHPDIAPELRQAENLASPVSSIALARVANVLNRIQLAGPTDAVWHIANMMSTIAGSQGGKTLLADLARKVPLVNVIDATVRVTQAAKKVLADDPDVMRQLAELAEIGQVRPERPGGGINSRIINLLDKAGRVVRDDMYRNLVNRGLVEASEAGRREFVGQLGQYNPRLMGQVEAFFKEAGLSPFIVAGRNFNRQALRRLSLSPGVQASNLASAAQMRAIEATGVIGTLVAVPTIINLLTTGKPGGRDPSIPFGAIDTGKDDKNGKHIYIDPAQWIGLRRGMRMTGINAVVEGMRRGTPMRQIEKRSGQDIIGALVHPWAGPIVQLPFVTATGYTTSGFKESKDPGDYWQNFKAALENVNPVVHGWFQKQPGTGVAGGLESAATSLLSAVGVKTKARATATSQVHDLAQNWASKSSDPKIRSEYEQHVKESFSSEYQDLRSALLRGDDAGAFDAYQQLRAKGKKPATIRQTLQHPHPFTGSQRAETRFRNSLTLEQRETYNKALEERRELYHRFQQMLQNERKPDASSQ